MKLTTIMIVAFLDDGTARQILLDRNTLRDIIQVIDSTPKGFTVHDQPLSFTLQEDLLPEEMKLNISLEIIDNTKKDVKN